MEKHIRPSTLPEPCPTQPECRGHFDSETLWATPPPGSFFDFSSRLGPIWSTVAFASIRRQPRQAVKSDCGAVVPAQLKAIYEGDKL